MLPEPVLDNRTASLSQKAHRKSPLWAAYHSLRNPGLRWRGQVYTHRPLTVPRETRQRRQRGIYRNGSPLLENSKVPDINFTLQLMANSKMRVAVAGTNTLALMIAHSVVTQTSHQLVILSRQVSVAYSPSHEHLAALVLFACIKIDDTDLLAVATKSYKSRISSPCCRLQRPKFDTACRHGC